MNEKITDKDILTPQKIALKRNITLQQAGAEWYFNRDIPKALWEDLQAEISGKVKKKSKK